MPNAENCSLAELETAGRATPTNRIFVRLTAIRALLLGIDRERVAELSLVTLRTLSNWVKKFNEQGIDGLVDRPRPGRPRHISAAQGAEYSQLIEKPELAGETHWTAKKFCGYLRHQLRREVGYRTVLRWLHDNDFRLKVPQPWPDRQDEQARQAFIERLRGWLGDDHIELWYLDECGVEGDPRPRRRWAKKGQKTRVTRNGEHIRMNVTGLICPRTGQFYALEFTHTDTAVFQAFLQHANADVKRERKRNLIICDNASWHKSRRLDWGEFEPAFLPPYSPDLNPIERLWLIIKAEWFTDFVAKDWERLIERLDQALVWAMERQTQNQRTCAIRKQL